MKFLTSPLILGIAPNATKGHRTMDHRAKWDCIIRLAKYPGHDWPEAAEGLAVSLGVKSQLML